MKKFIAVLALASAAIFAHPEEACAQPYQQPGYSVAATANAQFKGKVLVDKTIAVGNQVAFSGASAAIEFRDTDKVILLPRLTTSQISALDSVVAGMLVYRTTDSSLRFYNGSAWLEVSTE